MRSKITRAVTMIFFAAVIIVSAVLMTRQQDGEDMETANTMPEEYRTNTDVLPEENAEETSRRYGRDMDIASDTATRQTENAEGGGSSSAVTGTGSSSSETTAASAADTTASRTVITSRARKEYDSNSVYIDIENILQTPELPVGCEITALTILLRHCGFDAEKTDMAKNYLPTSWGNSRTEDGKVYKDSFFDYFIGDPFSKGYGCFSPAIEKAANKYISDHGGGYTVKNISGCHPDVLYEYLIADIPVICWATDGMIEPEYYETWYDNATGEKLDWYLNEHCFVLAGFNISASTVTLNDPMKGIIDYNIDKFEVRFKQMYSQAIVIIPDRSSVPAVTSGTAPAAEEDETSAGAVTDTGNVWTRTDTQTAEGSSETEAPVTEAPAETSEEETEVTAPPVTEEWENTGFFTGSFIYD
ncbi:MAG: C39 family peptidase [Ruminococcus sp.]|nr:C39 family peptidase [Ruminococcus sp.]